MLFGKNIVVSLPNINVIKNNVNVPILELFFCLNYQQHTQKKKEIQ